VPLGRDKEPLDRASLTYLLTTEQGEKGRQREGGRERERERNDDDEVRKRGHLLGDADRRVGGHLLERMKFTLYFKCDNKPASSTAN